MSLESKRLWQQTLAHKDDEDQAARDRLRVSLNSVRSRVEQLVSTLGSELPGLTVHDITHIDALWRVADVIAGVDYPINPAEAYVLGGAFLLHDSAHVLAAYPGGKEEIKLTDGWKDLVAQRYGSNEPLAGSPEEKAALFQVLRHLHADQARLLPAVSWKMPGSTHTVRLIEDEDLDQYYGDLIGEIASSHHWSANHVAETFADRVVSPPAFLGSASWSVDAMKIAFLLRTADAAHLDSLRAPWFLFALRQPNGVSEDHWRFQAKLGQPTLNLTGELVITCGSPFGADERRSWWLAYDAARIVDKELKDAFSLLRDGGRQTFAARSVLAAITPEAFARQVRVHGWEPVNVEPIISNIPKIVSVLGGEGLYGKDRLVTIRELVQNGTDAIRAARVLGLMEHVEGSIHIAILPDENGYWWIHVTDNGVGMSRHVLTNVLLDFGNSLWSSDLLREELPGLASRGYHSTGRFGIGFYSAFMLGDIVSVVSRRYERRVVDSAEQWRLAFEDGLHGRPVLSQPTGIDRLSSQGTRVSIKATKSAVERILLMKLDGAKPDEASAGLAKLAAKIAPALDVRITTSFGDDPKTLAVSPNDWLSISDEALLSRIGDETGSLAPLLDENNQILGRLMPAPLQWRGSANLVINGLVCGATSGLIGLVKAKGNNQDAKRTIASPAGSIASWRTWSRKAIASIERPTIAQLVRVHPLLPDEDLPLWRLSGEPSTLKALEAMMSDAEEIYFNLGDISHEESDEMGSDYFDELQFSEQIVTTPDNATPHLHTFLGRAPSTDFPWFLEVEPIDYEARFESKLRSVWSDFQKVEGEEVFIGTIRGVEISRYLTRYIRPA